MSKPAQGISSLFPFKSIWDRAWSISCGLAILFLVLSGIWGEVKGHYSSIQEVSSTINFLEGSLGDILDSQIPLRSLVVMVCLVIAIRLVALRRWDGFWWVTGIFIVLAICLVISLHYWPDWRRDGDSNSTIIRNVGIVIGGIIAMLLAIWRSVVSERQAYTARQSLLNERYQQGAEMLGNGVFSVRLGGIYALQRLAEEHYVHSRELRQETKAPLRRISRHP